MIQEKEFTRGLSTREAEKRVKTYGLNELKHNKKKSPVLIFLAQFNDFLVWVLIGATIISGFIGDKADAITILIIVIVNAILGFVQEFRTEKSLEALQELAAPTCKVIRDGNIKVVSSKELTIGDLVVLEAGDRIPADGTFIDAANMVVDESLLTGESVGISKDTTKGKNSGFMGTIVLKGRGLIIIDAIGMKTEMGKIANLLDNIEEDKSPLRERLDSLGKILVVMCIVVCLIVTILGIIRGNDITEMFLLGVSLAVAAIPEGLAAIVTVALALGVGRMLKRNALVRKLPAVETLGCSKVICSDKTGTLTQNKMTVVEINAKDKMLATRLGAMCTDSNIVYENGKTEINGEPTEIALVQNALKYNYNKVELYREMPRVAEIPFDSTRKMMTTVHKKGTRYIVITKGAPDVLLNKCNVTIGEKNRIEKENENMAKKALRVIAVAYKEIPAMPKNSELKFMEDGLNFVRINWYDRPT